MCTRRRSLRRHVPEDASIRCRCLVESRGDVRRHSVRRSRSLVEVDTPVRRGHLYGRWDHCRAVSGVLSMWVRSTTWNHSRLLQGTNYGGGSGGRNRLVIYLLYLILLLLLLLGP